VIVFVEPAMTLQQALATPEGFASVPSSILLKRMSKKKPTLVERAQEAEQKGNRQAAIFGSASETTGSGDRRDSCARPRWRKRGTGGRLCCSARATPTIWISSRWQPLR